MSNKWQPIETAPKATKRKDGTTRLGDKIIALGSEAGTNGAIDVVRISRHEEGRAFEYRYVEWDDFEEHKYVETSFWNPTHWMALPSKPKD